MANKSALVVGLHWHLTKSENLGICGPIQLNRIISGDIGDARSTLHDPGQRTSAFELHRMNDIPSKMMASCRSFQDFSR